MIKNIGFDLDGVICDLYPESFKVLKDMYPDNVSGNTFGYDWETEFNLTKEQVTNCFIECGNRGLLRRAPVFNECIDVLKKATSKFLIYIVTWRDYIPNAWNDTLYWLDHNSIPYYKLIFSKDKAKSALENKFLFYVDDNIDFVNEVNKTSVSTYFLRSPWNKETGLDNGIIELKSWKEIDKILQDLT